MTSAAARRDATAPGALPAAAWPIFQAVFLASGFAALLYQMIWQRLLTLFGGADVYSVTLIVSAFMAGLGLGSLAGGHVADRLTLRRRLHAFALSELAIAAFGAASVWILYDVLYARLGPVRPAAMGDGRGALRRAALADLLHGRVPAPAVARAGREHVLGFAADRVALRVEHRRRGAWDRCSPSGSSCA